MAQVNNTDFYYRFISAYRGESDYRLQRPGSNETERVSVALTVPEYSDPGGKPYYNFGHDQYKREVAAKRGLAVVQHSRRVLTKDELAALRDHINKGYSNEGGFEAYYSLTLRRGYYNSPTRSYARIIDNPDGSETHEYYDAGADSWVPITKDGDN